MGKCNICGKKSLFLKVDALGRCNECIGRIAAEKAKQEETEFNAYYANLLVRIGDLQEVIDVGNDPVAALAFLPRFQEKVEICESLQSDIHNPKYEKRLVDKLKASVTFRDDFNKRHGIGYLKEWGISVFADVITKEFSADKLLADLDKLTTSYKFQWKKAIKSVQESAAFQQKIDDIPSVDLTLSDAVYGKLNVSVLDELIKYSNITAKTSFDKIGSFVVIDVETTGLSSTKDRLVEVAAIKFEDWVPVKKMHTLLNPGRNIPAEASAINNITDEMVVGAPSFSQVIDCLNEFVGKFNIVGHNLPFDLKFLYRYGFDFTTDKRRYFDTCEIAKKVLKKPKMKWDKEYGEYVVNDNYDYDVEDYKLTTLCDYYQIRDNAFAHRALSDAFATGLLFKSLAQEKIDY